MYVEEIEKRVSIQRKVVVVGTGQVGATICYALMMSGIASTIVLINRNTDLSEGHAMASESWPPLCATGNNIRRHLLGLQRRRHCHPYCRRLSQTG